MKKVLIVALICILSPAFGQEEDPDLNQIIEQIISYSDEEFDLESLSEILYALHNRPVNINKASQSELQSIPVLSDEDILKILDFRNEYGAFLSHYELYLIEGLDSLKTTMILPFIRITTQQNNRDSIPLIKNIIKTSRKSMMIRYGRLLQNQKGYRNQKNLSAINSNQYFAGSSDYIYGRLELHEPYDFDIGLTFEKDAGEAFFINPGLKFYGFDHYAGYFRLLNRGVLKEFTIGDYQMHFGEGLVWGRGFLKKGSETISAVRNRHFGSHPYQGASESNFLRGITFTLGNRFFNCTGFVSRKALDAKILTDTTKSSENNYYASNLSSTGYHRTSDEIYAKGSIIEYTTGFNSNYFFQDFNLSLGATFAYNFWNYPLRDESRYYNQFSFNGNTNYGGSVYYNYYRGKFNVFGEASKSIGKGYGIVQGLIANILSNFETTLHIRYFSPEYYMKYGKSFAEYSGNNNEKGIYWGIKLMPHPKIELRGYVDIFRSLWLRYNITSPSTGNEIFLNARFQPVSSLHISITFKKESKQRNDSYNLRPVQTTLESIKRNYQFSFNFIASDHVKLQTKIQGSTYKLNELRTMGYCLAQDIAYENNKFKLRTRVAYFMTEDYFNRQYLYEHDVLYAYSLPAYNGHGLRTYLLFKYSPFRSLDIWIKASHNHYFDLDAIGSGLSTIPGNKKTEIKCQFRIKF